MPQPVTEPSREQLASEVAKLERMTTHLAALVEDLASRGCLPLHPVHKVARRALERVRELEAAMRSASKAGVLGANRTSVGERRGYAGVCSHAAPADRE